MKKIIFAVLPLFLAVGCSQKSAPVIDNSGSYYSKNGISRYAVIEHGDTLASIAAKYGVSESDVLELNRMHSAGEITPGRTIAIPFASQDRVSERVSKSRDVGYEASVNHDSGVSDDGYFYTREKTVREKEYSTDESGYNTSISESSLDSSVGSHYDAKPVHFGSSKGFKISSPVGSNFFNWPLYGDVLQRYGKNGNKFNDGINIAASMGDSVRAAGDGKVAYLGKEVEGYGNLVILKHDNGYMTAYAHLQDISVGKGAFVKRGDIIGSVGQSGSISEPQLHFSVRKGKKTVDPEAVE